MSDRAAQAAQQSDPDRNVQFRRWLPDSATGEETGTRVWHSDDVGVPMSRQRREAEAKWRRLTGQVAP